MTRASTISEWTASHAGARTQDLLSRLTNDRVVLVIGAPRSGTTWLAKIFDSHPDVIYRHEPDDGLPIEHPALAGGRATIARLIGTNTLRMVGKRPLFAKRFRRAPTGVLRAALIHGVHLMSRLGPIGQWIQGVRIPDLLDADFPDLRLVMKSVRARGFARLVTRVLPGARVVFIVRHPCGQIASIMRGTSLGKFASDHPLDDDLAADLAERRGETRAWDKLPFVEQLAWNWAAVTEEVLRELDGYDAMRIVRYEDLCASPRDEARSLLDFAGLPWDAQTDTFVARSTRANRPDRYYEVFQNSLEVPFRWRSTLPLRDQECILAIVERAGLSYLLKNTQERHDTTICAGTV